MTMQAAERLGSKRAFLQKLHPIFPPLSFSRSQPARATHASSQPKGSHAYVPMHEDAQEDIFTRYRRNVGMCIINQDGLVFSAIRVDDPDRTWQMPQGGIDEGEAAVHAAIRELKEETSITSVSVVGEIHEWLMYDFPTHVKDALGSSMQFDGQAQRWFLLQFHGDDSEINLDTSHKEFLEWKWMPLEKLPDGVVPFKRDVYRRVAESFLPKIKQLQEVNALS